MSCVAPSDGSALTIAEFEALVTILEEGRAQVEIKIDGKSTLTLQVGPTWLGSLGLANKAITQLVDSWWHRRKCGRILSRILATMSHEDAKKLPHYRRSYYLPLRSNGRTEDGRHRITGTLTRDKSHLSDYEKRILEVGETQAKQESLARQEAERLERVAYFQNLVQDKSLKAWCLDPITLKSIFVKGFRPMHGEREPTLNNWITFYRSGSEYHNIPVGAVCYWVGLEPDFIQWVYFDKAVYNDNSLNAKRLVTQLLGIGRLEWLREDGGTGDRYHLATHTSSDDSAPLRAEWIARWQSAKEEEPSPTTN